MVTRMGIEKVIVGHWADKKAILDELLLALWRAATSDLTICEMLPLQRGIR